MARRSAPPHITCVAARKTVPTKLADAIASTNSKTTALNMTDEVRKTIKVHGRVQGVGFRWWARHQARSLGLRGAVRNCLDGTVEVTLAGTREAVEEMCLRLATGPASADVRRLEELPPPDVVPNDFQIGL